MQFPESTKNNNLFSILACSAICVNAKKKCSDVLWMTVKCSKTTQSILHTHTQTYSVTWNVTFCSFFPPNGVEVAIGFSDLQTVNWLINKPTLPPMSLQNVYNKYIRIYNGNDESGKTWNPYRFPLCMTSDYFSSYFICLSACYSIYVSEKGGYHHGTQRNLRFECEVQATIEITDSCSSNLPKHGW